MEVASNIQDQGKYCKMKYNQKLNYTHSMVGNST